MTIMELSIPDLDDDVARRLSERAVRNSRSLQAEVRLILAAAVSDNTTDILAQIDLFRERLRGRVTGDSTDIIRQARDA